MKIKLIVTFCLLMVFGLISAQTNTPVENENLRTVTHTGIGLGSALAVVLSWDRNKSILWAILHGLFGWLYVIYFAITRK